ncbi:AAA family ATPase [Sphingomonas sp.]|uniref:AAA family ATPase n=1 Tax=Sphingomonas sp. TaxID=28214 RepID=UPI0025CFF833|nr:AAA family ATPase [Sphingomonas sp.]MBV9528337.1 AAA family ATPase [Sphingomonas sp.]
MAHRPLEADPWDGMSPDDERGPALSRRSPGLLQVEWAEEIEPHLNSLWLIKKTLPQQGLALIYGHPGSGKSFLAIDLAMHVALGWDWNGLRTRRGVVVYVGAEGQKGLRNRIVAFKRHHGISGPIPLALIPTPIDLYNSAADRAALSNAVRAAATRYGDAPALIVVDTLSKTLGAGKENTDDLAVYVANCGALAAEFECCVLPVHHRPKDAESTEPRGHGSLKGGVDTVVLVEAGKTKRARITKQKDDEERELLMFNLQPIELGNDDDGDPVTSCVIVPTFVATDEGVSEFDRKVARLPAGPHLVYSQLTELLEQAEVAIPSGIPDDEINRGRVGKVADLAAWRDKAIAASGTLDVPAIVPANATSGTCRDKNRDTAKKAFNRALIRLRNDGIVRVWEQWAWITYELPS